MWIRACLRYQSHFCQAGDGKIITNLKGQLSWSCQLHIMYGVGFEFNWRIGLKKKKKTAEIMGVNCELHIPLNNLPGEDPEGNRGKGGGSIKTHLIDVFCAPVPC